MNQFNDFNKTIKDMEEAMKKVKALPKQIDKMIVALEDKDIKDKLFLLNKEYRTITGGTFDTEAQRVEAEKKLMNLVDKAQNIILNGK